MKYTPEALEQLRTLNNLKINLLTEKARLQRNGEALEEPLIPDESDNYIAQNANELPSVMEAFNSQEDNSDVLNGLLHNVCEDPQISIEDAIKVAENSIAFASTVAEQAPAAAVKHDARADVEIKLSFRQRLIARQAAKAFWHVKKSQLEYERACKKTDIKNLAYGLDFAIAMIDEEVVRVKKEGAVE